jgi:hypothetical protein
MHLCCIYLALFQVLGHLSEQTDLTCSDARSGKGERTNNKHTKRNILHSKLEGKKCYQKGRNGGKK